MAVSAHNSVISVATGLSETYAVMDGVVSYGLETPRETIDLTAFDDGPTRRRFASLTDVTLTLSGDLELGDTATQMIKAAYRAQTPIYVKVLYDGTYGLQSSYLVESIESSGSIEGKSETSISLKADGGMTPVDLPSGAVAPTVTIDAMPYTRTVAMGSINITGTTTNTPTSMSWSASPSGASGSITPGATWSATISISPSSSGEGVETITVTASNAGGSGNDTVTIGFYVAGAHSWFNSQNINGSYNSGMVNNDSVATWTNLGSSAKNVTQGTGSAQPTYLTSVGTLAQPVVSFDSGDTLAAATTADWDFLGGGSGAVSVETVFRYEVDANAVQGFWSCYVGNGPYCAVLTSTTQSRSLARLDTTNATQTTDTVTINNYHLHQATKTAGTAVTSYLNGTSVASTAGSGDISAGKALNLGNGGGATVVGLQGDILQFRAYQSELTSTQLAINKAVDEWMLGGSVPLTP